MKKLFYIFLFVIFLSGCSSAVSNMIPDSTDPLQISKALLKTITPPEEEKPHVTVNRSVNLREKATFKSETEITVVITKTHICVVSIRTPEGSPMDITIAIAVEKRKECFDNQPEEEQETAPDYNANL